MRCRAYLYAHVARTYIACIFVTARTLVHAYILCMTCTNPDLGYVGSKSTVLSETNARSFDLRLIQLVLTYYILGHSSKNILVKGLNEIFFTSLT